ncbi:MAG: S-adenosylmethionine:tRNA ribosyltransferase-isomerase [Actinomycetota bacterium]|nr:S-adenosylmethionine:tRNA ribosyltransferase-isomerase [Actinomycetota bacterium]
MITNFHLPQSSLLVMVSAFAGQIYILRSYREAKRKDYRFFSFGDCMLIN